MGQYKVPFSLERSVSSGNLNLVDRSIVNKEFTVDRDIGLDLRSKDLFGLGLLRYYVGIYAGEGRNTFDFSDFGVMALARVELLPLGMFKDSKQGDLKRTASPKLAIGVAYAFVDNAKRDKGILGSVPEDGGTTDTHNATADLVFMWRGLSLFSAFHFRDGRRNPPNDAMTVDPVRDGYGLLVQPGYLLPWIDLEIVARFAMTRPSFSGSALDRKNELGGGLSYYFVSHSMKLQADNFTLWTTGEDSENFFRLQLQAAF